MQNKNILFLTQDVNPFTKDTPMAMFVRTLAADTKKECKDIRILMPKYGSINERINKLHEVIRLSGINLIMNNDDYSLMVKVASIQKDKTQVYFIDNNELFADKGALYSKKENEWLKNNDLKSAFYVKGALDTVKKLGWIPELIHCNGWFTFLAAIYLKTYYKNDPHYKNVKIVCSFYNCDKFSYEFDKSVLTNILTYDKINANLFTDLIDGDKINYNFFLKIAIKFSDGIIFNSELIEDEIVKMAKDEKVDLMEYKEDYLDLLKSSINFFDHILSK